MAVLYIHVCMAGHVRLHYTCPDQRHSDKAAAGSRNPKSVS